MEPITPANPVTTPTEPAPMSPMTRWVRTFLQVVGALIVAVPTAAASFGVPAATAAKFVGWMAGAVILVSAVHNVLNGASAARKASAVETAGREV